MHLRLTRLPSTRPTLSLCINCHNLAEQLAQDAMLIISPVAPKNGCSTPVDALVKVEFYLTAFVRRAKVLNGGSLQDLQATKSQVRCGSDFGKPVH